jgi:DNA excision repair protein ERCC-3
MALAPPPSHESQPFWPVRTTGTWAHARGYQTDALRAIPREGKSITVLPCGAGKTMVGALAAARLRSPSGDAPNILLITYNREAVVQYARNLMDNLEIAPFEVFEYTGNTAARRRGMSLTCGWKLTHFYMLTQGPGSKLNKESSDYQHYINNTRWDAVIIDEAHLAPATHFSAAIHQIAKRARCMISLTATYVRSSTERDMDQLFGFLGSVVYRLKWTQLERDGYIAKLRFMQVACDLTPMWRRAWEACVAQDRLNVQMLPPSKLEAMVAIVRAHQAHGEIGLIFADGLVVVEQAVRILREELQQDWRAVVGETPTSEREELFRQLNEGLLPGLFFSRVGEAANDFRNPRIRYVITVCSAGSSETQFAQRAGRASRTEDVPSAGESAGAALARRLKHQKEACIYDLYTVGTNEEPWANGRVGYLMDEGYSFKKLKSEELMSRVVPPLPLYRMSDADACKLLQQMLAKAHNAQVERRVHEALMLTQREQREEMVARKKRIGGMREGIMRTRAVQQEKRTHQTRVARYAEARRQESERVRSEMGAAESLRFMQQPTREVPHPGAPEGLETVRDPEMIATAVSAGSDLFVEDIIDAVNRTGYELPTDATEARLEEEVCNRVTGRLNDADSTMAVCLSHVPARISFGVGRPSPILSP